MEIDLHTFKLQHDSLILSPLSLHDAHNLFALTDRNRTYLREWLPWLDFTQVQEDTEKFISIARANDELGKTLHLGIWFEDALVGVVGFNSISKADKAAVIGYWLDQHSQGKGIMTQACRLLIDFGFKKLNLHRMEIQCAVGNDKSCAIPLRLGFTQEGILRDSEWLYDHYVSHRVFGLLQHEWNG